MGGAGGTAVVFPASGEVGTTAVELVSLVAEVGSTGGTRTVVLGTGVAPQVALTQLLLFISDAFIHFPTSPQFTQLHAASEVLLLWHSAHRVIEAQSTSESSDCSYVAPTRMARSIVR